MPAIGVHHTATMDEAWDGPANEAQLRTGESESYYRDAFAWQDPDGDPETKTAYRFIHHMVDGNGDVGAANVRACITGIAVLNGARGGSIIPDSDRRGVWEHLAAHLEDGGMEPPDLRAWVSDLERRSVPLREIRVERVGDQQRILGYAAVFNVLSVPLWGFRERIRPGAFRKTLQEADIRALWNHDPNFVFGRSKAGTLRLAEDETGLKVDVTPPATQWAQDFMISIDRGDVDQMSFGFDTIQEEWSTQNGETIRTLVEVRLSDVSFVTFPAYPQTVAQLRAVYDLDPASVQRALRHLERGELDVRDFRLMRDFLGCVAGESRGENLASLLNQGIDDQMDEDTSRADIISRMAREAGIAVDTVRNILSAEINCPPIERLRGFARVLGISLDEIIQAAQRDGCEYDQRDAGPAGGGHLADGASMGRARARLARMRRRLELAEIE